MAEVENDPVSFRNRALVERIRAQNLEERIGIPARVGQPVDLDFLNSDGFRVCGHRPPTLQLGFDPEGLGYIQYQQKGKGQLNESGPRLVPSSPVLRCFSARAGSTKN